MDRNSSNKISLPQSALPSKLLSENVPTYPGIGRGVADAHHGELLQGVLDEDGGHLHRVLISLPCKLFKSEAVFLPDQGRQIRVVPGWKVKARKAVELALAYTHKRDWGGYLHISSNIPVRWGLGSSTSDVTAAIRAVANAFHEEIEPSEVARLAVSAETSSDSTMFDQRTILFAHREGTVIEDFGAPAPDFEVLGFNTDTTHVGIDTLNSPLAQYSRSEIEMFHPLISLFRRAIQTRDLRLIGEVASESAYINQRYLPKPHFDRLNTIVRLVGAVGFQVAHSGTVAGFIFDPNDFAKEDRIQQAQALVAETGISNFWRFEHKGSAPQEDS